MTRRPRSTKKARGAVKPVAKRAGIKSAPLDEFVSAGAQALDLKIEKSWLPAVRGHLAVTLRHAALVAEFSLPDDAEPAPVFKV